MSIAELLSTINCTSASITCNFLPTYIMVLIDSPVCRKCGAEEETWAHVLWECESLATLKICLSGFLFLGPWVCQKSRSGYIVDLYPSSWYHFNPKRTKIVYFHTDTKSSGMDTVLNWHTTPTFRQPPEDKSSTWLWNFAPQTKCYFNIDNIMFLHHCGNLK